MPEGTLLYVRHVQEDRDVLVARGLSSDEEVIITDLTGDGSSGWRIDSYALSPDRRRIALSSLYGPTAEDNATGLATPGLWSLGVDGKDFRRWTAVFEKESGKQNFVYEVGDSGVYRRRLSGALRLRFLLVRGDDARGRNVAVDRFSGRDELHSSFETSTTCSVLYPARNPVTGDFLMIHSVHPRAGARRRPLPPPRRR